MGPGVTEGVALGTEQQTEAAKLAAQETGRLEKTLIGAPEPPNVAARAAEMHPETFRAYTALQQYRNALAEFIEEQPEGVDTSGAAKHLAEVTAEIEKMEPEVASAYRRAAEVSGAEPVPPPEPPAPLPPEQAESIAADRAFIASDVARQLIAAGRPEEEAKAAGELVAARFVARAERMGGVLGTPREIYTREGAEIESEFRPPRKVPYRPIEVSTFIRRMGGIKDVGGNLKAMGLGPGIINNRSGVTLKEAHDALIEAGYILPPREWENPDERDVLDLLAKSHMGEKVYSLHDQARWLDIMEERERVLHEEHERDLMEDAADRLEKHIQTEYPGFKIKPEEKRFATEILIDKLSPDEALERLAIALESAEDYAPAVKAAEDIPFDDIIGGAAREARTRAREGGEGQEPSPGGEGEAQPHGEAVAGPGAGGAAREEEPIEFFQRKRKGELSQADLEAKGQTVLPGAEPISTAELLKRRAEAPLKPTAEQNLVMDEGLFGDEAKQKELFQSELAEPFYSGLARAVEGAKLAKGTADQWLGTLKNLPGVKSEEMEWLGLEDWLREQEGAVTKEQVQDYIRANEIKVQEVVNEENRPWGSRGTSPIFSRFQLPGGENYRELLLTLPPKEGGETFTSGHFDEPNVVAHVRFNDRVDANGKRTLFIEEIQSDWHQKGRKYGYDERPQFDAALKELLSSPEHAALQREQRRVDELFGRQGFDEAVVVRDAAARARGALAERLADAHGLTGYTRESFIDNASHPATTPRYYAPDRVPDAPFKTSWPELALKRMIRWAAENGYDQIAWTPGIVQIERYPEGLRQVATGLSWHADTHGDRFITIEKRGGETITIQIDKNAIIRAATEGSATAKGKPLEELIGKPMTEQIMAAQSGEIAGKDFTVGGKGMEDFYDKILVNAANKLGKKYGAKVGTTTIDAGRKYAPGSPGAAVGADRKGHAPKEVWSLPITDELRDAATAEGFPLFQVRRGSITFRKGGKPLIKLMREANASTFIHESGHQYLEELMRDAEHAQAPQQIKDDARTVLDWLGVRSRAEIKRRQHEKFARGFEQYLREGVAPSPELAGVFARFKAWLMQIYRTLRGLGQPISDDIRRVFDRMLTTERPTVIAEPHTGGPTLAEIHASDAELTPSTEAEPAADRISAETDRFMAELPTEIADELETSAAESEAAGPEAGAAVASGEAGGGAGEGEQVGPGAEQAGPQPGGAGGGAEPVQIGESGTQAAGESAVAGPERGRGAGKTAQHPLAPNPPDLFGTRETPFLDKAGNIRLDNLVTALANAPDRVEAEKVLREVLTQAAEANNDFIGARRGVVTDGQVMELADALGKTPDWMFARKIGQAWNAEQIWAARRAIIQSALNVDALAKKAAASGNEQDMIAAIEAVNRHAVLQANLSGATAEWGRAGRAFRAMRALGGTAANADEAVRAMTGKTLFQMQQSIKTLAQMDTPFKVSKTVRDMVTKPSWGRMLMEYFVNNLISGIATHVTYTVGNAGLLLGKIVLETPTAAAISALRGRPGVRFGETVAGLQGLARGLPAALKGVGQAIKSGAVVRLPGEIEQFTLPFAFESTVPVAEAAMQTTWADIASEGYAAIRGLRDAILAHGALLKAGGVAGENLIGVKYSPTGVIPNIAVKGVTVLPVGEVVRAPSRMVTAIHTLFSVLNYSVEINRLAWRRAAEEGLRGEAFFARVADLRQNPSLEMMEAAAPEAREMTLMGQGGAFIRKVAQLTNYTVDLPGLGETQPLKFIDPFVKVAGQVAQRAIGERSPLGILSSETRADLMGENGAAAQDMAMAKMLVGTVLGITFAGLAAEGFVTGSGPEDPAEAAMWRLAGYQPYSVRIGDTWYQTHRLGPLGILTGIGADLYDIARLASEKGAEQAVTAFLYSVTRNFMEEGFMAGPAQLLQAIEDSDRYGPRYVTNFLSGFVPFSVGLRQMDRATDPYLRRARGVVEGIKAEIPWLSQTLMPKRDIWGEPIPNLPALGGRALTVITEQKLSRDPVNKAMLDLGIHPGPVSPRIRGVLLNEQQYDDYARIAGRMAKMRLDVIVRSPDWQRFPPHVKHDVIEGVIRGSRETARGIMLMKYPDIVAQATQNKLDRLRAPSD